jgi:hypothetical protein
MSSGLEIRVYFETAKTLGIRMSKHSPAPWTRCGQKDDPCGSAIIMAANGFEVANSRSFLVEEYEANANLIAAAPEMLSALKGFVKAWSEGRFLMEGYEYLKACRDAIQKAEGCYENARFGTAIDSQEECPTEAADAARSVCSSGEVAGDQASG